MTSTGRTMLADGHSAEVARGARFQFGANWARFLAVLDEDRILAAERSLQEMLGLTSLAGYRFLDVGSGSGLFSLAAHRLGAAVHSFDYDPESVACTRELKRRYFPDSQTWAVEEGSALDTEYLATLGTYDIVYSWGVLHHTGRMWDALHNVAALVHPQGQLFIAIYNDQGSASGWWGWLKRFYNSAPSVLQPLIVGLLVVCWELRAMIVRLRQGKNPFSFAEWRRQGRERGMSPWHDFVDWVGGYPFEVATPARIEEFYRARGFRPARVVSCGSGHGCNQYVLTLETSSAEGRTALLRGEEGCCSKAVSAAGGPTSGQTRDRAV